MKMYSEISFKPKAMNMVEVDGKLWMAMVDRNGICEVDKQTRRVRICEVFAGEFLSSEFLYNCVEKAGNKLVFAPCSAQKIAVYDVDSKSMTYIPLKEIEYGCKENQDEGKFWNVFRNRSNVYLLGYSYPAIIKIDMETMEVTYITDWLGDVEENIETGDNCGYFGDGHFISDNMALIPIGCMNAVLELDLKTDNTKIRKVKGSMKGIGGLASTDGETIWLVGRGGKVNRVYCWNRRSEQIKEIKLDVADEKKFDPFYAPICAAEKVILMPLSADSIYEIDIHTDNVKKSEVLNRELNQSAGESWGYKTMMARLFNNQLFFVASNTFKLYEYNVITEEVQSYYIYLDDNEQRTEKYFHDVCSELRESGAVFSETKVPLKYFLNDVIRLDVGNVCRDAVKNGDGTKIYDRICGRF